MTVWHWVRHGPTHKRSLVGWRDVPADLSDRGRIEGLRAHLPEEAIVVSSDLLRARCTADAISGPAHHRLPPDPHLREMHFGLWDGLHFDEVTARDPHLSRQFWENPGETAAPGGESWNMTARRVQAAVDRISARYPGRHIIAVAHLGVILTQLQRTLNVPPHDALAHRIDNLSVTTLDWSGPAPRVHHINHLP